jgi:hypothetical protein
MTRLEMHERNNRIRARAAEGPTRGQLAREFDLTRQAISNILHGRCACDRAAWRRQWVLEPSQVAHQLSDLAMNERTENALRVAGIANLAQLLSARREDLIRIGNFGRQSLAELELELDRHGLRLRAE